MKTFVRAISKFEAVHVRWNEAFRSWQTITDKSGEYQYACPIEADAIGLVLAHSPRNALICLFGESAVLVYLWRVEAWDPPAAALEPNVLVSNHRKDE